MICMFTQKHTQIKMNPVLAHMLTLWFFFLDSHALSYQAGLDFLFFV